MREHRLQKHVVYSTIPFGPRVLLTRSPIAIAPTNDDWNNQRKCIQCATASTSQHDCKPSNAGCANTFDLTDSWLHSRGNNYQMQSCKICDLKQIYIYWTAN